MLKIDKYFMKCCELHTIKEFTTLSLADKNSILLKGLINHLSNVNIQIVTAGIYRQTDLTLLVSRIAVNKAILLLDIKVSKPSTSRVQHSPVDYVVECVSRANSIDISKIGLRSLQLHKMFTIVQK